MLLVNQPDSRLPRLLSVFALRVWFSSLVLHVPLFGTSHRPSDFGLLSDFGFLVSDFRAALPSPCLAEWFSAALPPLLETRAECHLHRCFENPSAES